MTSGLLYGISEDDRQFLCFFECEILEAFFHEWLHARGKSSALGRVGAWAWKRKIVFRSGATLLRDAGCVWWKIRKATHVHLSEGSALLNENYMFYALNLIFWLRRKIKITAYDSISLSRVNIPSTEPNPLHKYLTERKILNWQSEAIAHTWPKTRIILGCSINFNARAVKMYIIIKFSLWIHPSCIVDIYKWRVFVLCAAQSIWK